MGRYNIRGTANAHTNRKDDNFMQRRLLYIDEAHVVLDIFKNEDILKNKDEDDNLLWVVSQ